MQFGRQAKVPVPAAYKNFRLIRIRGRVFGIPQSLDPEGIVYTNQLYDHPAVLSAATVAEVQELIDRFDESTIHPEVIGQIDGYDVIRLGDRLYGVPISADPADLHLPAERARVGAIPAASVEELEAKIRQARAATAVEFGGWLPVYEPAGNCGRHPQFAHAGDPPGGYRFTSSAPPVPRRPSTGAKITAFVYDRVSKVGRGIAATTRVFGAFFRPRRGVTMRARFRVFWAMMRLVFTLLRQGCRPRAILVFLQTRNLQSQLLLGDHRDPVFLTSMPFTFGQHPWLIEIEDPTTLFFPMVQNGHTCDLDLRAAPCFPIVKAMLEADNCKAILTHMRSTARFVATLFESDVIRSKVVYAPLGVKLPARWQRHDPQPPDEPIHLLFINSWCQVPENFYVRGGLDILEAFDILRERYPQLRLTLRTDLPELADHYHRILESGWVRVIQRFMTSEEMAELHAQSHIFLLPAARIHVVSLLQAMSHGLAVVASDGWGIDEYLTHERNGLVVRGRYGKTSWADDEAGLLRENYEPMYTSDPEVVAGIVEAVSRLVEDETLRRLLGRAARRDVETIFTRERWNEGVREALGRAAGAASDPVPEPPAGGKAADTGIPVVANHGGVE